MPYKVAPRMVRPEQRIKTGGGVKAENRSPARQARDGLIEGYLTGPNLLDIGFRGGNPQATPVTDNAIGVDLDYPGYDGTHLPFPDRSQDAVHASHILEHVPNYREVLAEWHRVTKLNGHLIIIVPHWHLYERRPDLPSFWNGVHQRFYTPARLLAEIESSLSANSYRVRLLADNDRDFNYQDPPDVPPKGGLEIVLVLQKIAPPDWSNQLAYSPAVQGLIDRLDGLIFQAVSLSLKDPHHRSVLPALVGKIKYFTPWPRLRQRFVFDGALELGGQTVAEKELREAVAPLLSCVEIDETVYKRHSGLRDALAKGTLTDLAWHWRNAGYFEGRVCHEYGLLDDPPV
jgi:SAM-dependent methyltransferase